MEQDPIIVKEENTVSLQDFSREVWGDFVTVAKWVLSGLIEAFFIVCLVLTQWVVNTYIIIPFSPTEGADITTLIIAQWLFAIATLAPIAFRLIRLVVTMAIRTYKYTIQEMEKGAGK